MPELRSVLPLLDLQKLDLVLLQKRKKLDELPYAKEIVELAHLIESLKTKESTLHSLHKQTSEEDTQLSLELAQNRESIHSIEETIRLKSGDYRLVSSLTCELEHLSELKGVLQQKQLEALSKLERVEQLESDLKTILDQKQALYQKYSTAYEQEGKSVLQEIALLEDMRRSKVGDIDPDLLKRYERSLLQHKGVGISLLDQETCSVCRHRLSASHLSQVKTEAPLSRCPHCSRLLVVRK